MARSQQDLSQPERKALAHLPARAALQVAGTGAAAGTGLAGLGAAGLIAAGVLGVGLLAAISESGDPGGPPAGTIVPAPDSGGATDGAGDETGGDETGGDDDWW